MYDWCGQDHSQVLGVAMKSNRHGRSSGFVEYEAYLYAKWFLETVQKKYPNINDQIVRRYVKFMKFLNSRFLGWYSDSKPPSILLREFEDHFRDVCPDLVFTRHPRPAG